jgi:predicted tellurium resistance membrane protein TerC
MLVVFLILSTSLEYQDQHKALCDQYKNAIVTRVAMLIFDMLQFNVDGIPHTKQLISLE